MVSPESCSTSYDSVINWVSFFIYQQFNSMRDHLPEILRLLLTFTLYTFKEDKLITFYFSSKIASVVIILWGGAVRFFNSLA